MLYVSHSPADVRKICTRAIYLVKGQVVFDGDVEEALTIYEQQNAGKAKAAPKKK